jgi:hypothetical protein
MDAEATRTAGTYVKHRPTFEPQPDPLRKLSLGSMSRRHCPRCDDREALFAGSRCCSCGADFSKPMGRAKRTRGWNGAALRAPIVEADSNLMALMAAKR